MKSLFLTITGMVLFLTISFSLHRPTTPAYATTGDRPNQVVIPYRNVSSSAKPSGCVIGEMRQNSAYLFICNTSSKWRRINKGNGF